MFFGDFDVENNDTDTVYKDTITLMLLGIVFLFIIILFHINPVAKEDEGEIKQPGNIAVEISWPAEQGMDIDLWVRAPGDTPVGYSNKASKYFNLVRDDLGNLTDELKLNFENSFSRGAPPGEYVVNVHLYNQNNFPLPINVYVGVIIRDPTDEDATETKFNKTVTLTEQGQELTVFRFKIDENGDLVEGSTHDLPVKLWGAR